MAVTKRDLRAALDDLDVRSGSWVMVHSSLSSFGRFGGGAAAVIETLMETIGDNGVLMMPSFNHGAPFRNGGAGYYDPAETPTTNGRIPDTFRRMPGVHRSLNPTHPIAAWGGESAALIQTHHRTLTMGPDSPLGRLGRQGGAVLLIGVNYSANTFHHVVETTTGAPCLGRRTEELPVRLPDGRRVLGRTWSWRAAPCPLNDGNRYADLMAPHERVATLGGARVTSFVTVSCFDVVAELLAEGRHGYPPCRRCPIRPKSGPYTVPSDWDEETGRPIATSSSWTY